MSWTSVAVTEAARIDPGDRSALKRCDRFGAGVGLAPRSPRGCYQRGYQYAATCTNPSTESKDGPPSGTA